MADGCPDRFYRDRNTGTCKKSIETKREWVYGRGFLSETQSEQHSKIRQAEKSESPELVDEQMSALNSYTSGDQRLHPAAHSDLEYAESFNGDTRNLDEGFKAPKFGGQKGGEKGMPGSCGPGEEYVEGYEKEDGTKVAGYCRKVHPHLSEEDRRIDSENGRKSRGRR